MLSQLSTNYTVDLRLSFQRRMADDNVGAHQEPAACLGRCYTDAFESRLSGNDGRRRSSTLPSGHCGSLHEQGRADRFMNKAVLLRRLFAVPEDRGGRSGLKGTGGLRSNLEASSFPGQFASLLQSLFASSKPTFFFLAFSVVLAQDTQACHSLPCITEVLCNSRCVEASSRILCRVT